MGTKETRAGFKAPTYELTAKAHLAMLLNSTSLDELLTKADETTATVILSDIVYRLLS